MPSSVGDLLNDLTQQFAGVSDSPRLDAEVLLGFVLAQTKTWLYTWPERELSESQLVSLQALVARRLQGEPIAHLTGQRDFWSLELEVTPDTLIPRPETELLVEIVLALLSDRQAEKMSLLDMGTGTGAIALALASERPAWQIDGVDRIAAAVELAERNRRRLNIPNATFLQSDWFSGLRNRRFHLIVSNPPYIDCEDVHLNQGDVRFEPRSALVADEQGLADIQHIVREAPGYLLAQGWLLFEHGYRQGDAVRRLLIERGFSHVETRCDLAGLERATFGCWTGG